MHPISSVPASAREQTALRVPYPPGRSLHTGVSPATISTSGLAGGLKQPLPRLAHPAGDLLWSCMAAMSVMSFLRVISL